MKGAVKIRLITPNGAEAFARQGAAVRYASVRWSAHPSCVLSRRLLVLLAASSSLAVPSAGRRPPRAPSTGTVYSLCDARTGTRTSPAEVDSIDTSNGQCPSVSTVLPGTRGDGEACSSPADRAPTCCACATGQGWLSASCIVKGTARRRRRARAPKRWRAWRPSCSSRPSSWCRLGFTSVVASCDGEPTDLSDACDLLASLAPVARSRSCASDGACSSRSSCMSQCDDETCADQCSPSLSFDNLEPCAQSSCAASCGG